MPDDKSPGRQRVAGIRRGVRRFFWLALRRPALTQAESDAELASFVEERVAHLVARGMAPDEARGEAVRRLGGSLDAARAQLRQSSAQRDRRLRLAEVVVDLVQDVRYAVRGIRRAPIVAITVVLTIALGLGLNTTTITVFNAYVLRPLAVRDPSSLYSLSWRDRGGRARTFDWDEYRELRTDRRGFAESFAYRPLFARIDEQPTFGVFVSGNYFRMLGIGASLGRTLSPADDIDPAAVPVAVLNWSFWQSRFGSDSGIVGRRLVIHGVTVDIVGVAQRGFGGIESTPCDFWVPLVSIHQLGEAPGDVGPGRPSGLMVVGRLAPGVSEQATVARFTNAVRAMTETRRAALRADHAELVSRATAWPLSPELFILFGPILVAMLLVLLLACANVANMMLARGVARQREIGIRLSLGAARARLVRQLLTESIVLALPASALGFGISWLSIGAGRRLILATVPGDYAKYIRMIPLEPDLRVLVIMLAAAIGAALLFGLVPALQATRPDIVQTSRGNFDAAHRPSHVRGILVVTQITVCVLLLVAAGILLQGSRRVQHLDPGVRVRGVAQLELQERFRDRVLPMLIAHPLVERVAGNADAPLDGAFPRVAVYASAREERSIDYSLVSSGYFGILEIPLLSGRTFSESEEKDGLPVVIVSETAARALWPGRAAIGQTLQLASDREALKSSPLATFRSAVVIGVVRNAVSGVLAFGIDRAVAYYPTSVTSSGTRLLLRTRGLDQEAVRLLSADLDRLAPGGLLSLHTLDQQFAVQAYPFDVAFWISNVVAGIALLLTLSGVYGVLSYVVVQRTKEFGIRVALGASRGDVTALVLRQSMRLAAYGIAIGVLFALGASKLLSTLVEAYLEVLEPTAYAGGVVVVLAACLVAAWIPSRRATLVNPAATMRHD